MPELSDDMYCSQQIMVPPMFPYILRQYAKAAIRCQPTDLLRWSCAYFRCLSLNVPPPVKPRLEYPLPRDYDGITPGWLKALLHQFQNSLSVNFKTLFERWSGACQNHGTLLKVLCTGGFNDPMAVPLLRFIALCVGFLCENLTQTMILVCEVITEEPEGGSAMIQVETFIDLYRFLARIDASKDQVLLNDCFTDNLLELIEKKEAKRAVAEKKKRQTDIKESSIEEEATAEEEKPEEEMHIIVSCPDLLEDTTKSSTEVEENRAEEEAVEAESHSTVVEDDDRRGGATATTQHDPNSVRTVTSGTEFESSAMQPPVSLEEATDGGERDHLDDEETQVEIFDAVDNTRSEKTEKTEERPLKEEKKIEELQKEVTEEESKLEASLEEKTEDGANLIEELGEGYYAEMAGEADEAVDGQAQKQKPLDILQISEGYSISAAGDEEEMPPEDISKFAYEEIFVEALPGIGPQVPEDLINAVVVYMKKCAEEQHGMVMPRNIRHYSCPPLEVFTD